MNIMGTDWSQIYGSEQWAWIVRLGKAISDPEEKKGFWEVVKSKKLADPNYSIFTDFPREIDKKESETSDGGTSRKAIALKYCSEILADLNRHLEAQNELVQKTQK